MGVLEDFIARSNDVESQEELARLFFDTLGLFGYDRVNYCLLTDHTSLDLKAQFCLLSNFPEDFVDHYTEQGYERHDPILRRLFQTGEPFAWEQMLESPNVPMMGKKVLHEAREARLLKGLVVPLFGPNLEMALIGFASSAGDAELDKRTFSHLRVLANQFHITYSSLIMRDTEPINYVGLTAREEEILLWSAQGKSMTDIANILSMSDDNVKYHLKKIYRKLNVSYRIQAVMKALSLGLINPGDLKFLRTLPK